MSEKPIAELSTEEAEAALQECVLGTTSDFDLRNRLNTRGFNDVLISSISSGDMYMAMVMTWGPDGEIIRG